MEPNLTMSMSSLEVKTVDGNNERNYSNVKLKNEPETVYSNHEIYVPQLD